MSGPEGEMWALRLTECAAEVWTENGKLVAHFVSQDVAEEVIDDHNIGVEMDRPEPPEVVRSRAQEKAARIAEWRVQDPYGADLTNLIVTAGARLSNLLSLKAPRAIIVQSIDTICERTERLRGLYAHVEEAEETPQ